MKRYLLDDKEIAHPPYGGPAGKPLPDRKPTEEQITKALAGILGKSKKSAGKKKEAE